MLAILGLESEYLGAHNLMHSPEVRRKSDGHASEIQLGEPEFLLLVFEVKDVKVEVRSIA